MNLFSILGNSQKLDGGACFGNAPKPMWEKWIRPDELNRVPFATRVLLVQTQNHLIMFEAGIGAYREPKLAQRFGIEEQEHVLLERLSELGFTPADITDVIISHLHFDHAGGLLSSYNEKEPSTLLFENARYHVGAQAWERALNPHPRDRASFVPHLNAQIESTHRLNLVDGQTTLSFDELQVTFFESCGHTPGMICSCLQWGGNTLYFGADLIPGCPWVHVPISMGYDRYPEMVIDEKRKLLSTIHEKDAWLFYTHDYETALSKIEKVEAKNSYTAVHKYADLREVVFAD